LWKEENGKKKVAQVYTLAILGIRFLNPESLKPLYLAVILHQRK